MNLLNIHYSEQYTTAWIKEAFSYNMNTNDKRDIKKIIFQHFEYIVEQWEEFQRGIRDE